MLPSGSKAPDFSATLSNGKPIRLRDYRDRRHLVLYFFPKVFTPGCTREACSFRDHRAEVAELDGEIIGVSYDTAEKQSAFVEKYNLPFPMVSDASGDIAQAYGVTRLGGWLPHKRVTFVIRKDGVIERVIQSELSIDKHVDEAIEALRTLRGK